jgi:hypothetical protein
LNWVERELTYRFSAISDVADELPGNSVIGTGIKVELSFGQIGRNGITSEQNRAGRVSPDALLQQEKLGLITKAPAIDSIL